ncbi:MAG: hypothetical protein ACLFUJ_09625 [Phycisphaerae bacterium]
MKTLLTIAAAAVLIPCHLQAMGDQPEKPLPLQPDEPLVAKPKPGSVQGQIRPAGKIKGLSAVCRVTGTVHQPDRLDKETGQFAFDSLPGGQAYDICIATADGRVIEGIDLRFVDQRLMELAEIRGKQLDLPAAPAHRFTQKDAQAVAQFVGRQEDFMDWGRTLYVRGHGRYATALVELMRTRAFHAGAGQVIWRVELWYFEFQAGGWERLNNQHRVLRRVRVSPQQWKAIHVEYVPSLSVYVDADGKSKPVDFQIPEKPDVHTSRPAGSEPKLPAKPILLGLEDDKPEESSP